jgi:NAD(P)-dependent dehydrogenase (short-subunit alcohol dehydrogenase family)
MSFHGVHVVVTGASGALGAGVVATLVEQGAILHLPLVEPAIPAHLPSHVSVRPTTGVVLTDEAAVEGYFAGLPPLSASIHLVGGFAMAPVVDTRLADFQAMHEINTVSCFLACREAVRAMRRAGGGGRIVNVISRAALSPGGGSIAYTAAKAGVAAITQALAAELRDEGILVNAVAPSTIDTPANRAAMPDADHRTWVQPREIASLIAYLASTANTATSGALVPVYGRA